MFPIPQNAKRSLFIYKAISSHFKKKKRRIIDSPEKQLKAERRRFKDRAKRRSNSWITPSPKREKIPVRYEKPLFRELYLIGYPEKSIDSLMDCGKEAGYMIRECCERKLIPIKYRCNNRTCPDCSQIRKKRIKTQYLPYLKSLKTDNSNNFYFVTNSPKNYEDLGEGLEDIKKNFRKWLRRDYVHERVKWGIWVIEVKQTWPGKPQYDQNNKFLYYHTKFSYNIHIHFIYYGRRLDNRIRGECKECHQNLLRYDKVEKRYYCANKNCNSTNVIAKKNSRIVEEWKKSSGSETHFYIPSQDRYFNRNLPLEKTLNYMLKYISTLKSDFYDEKSLALYISLTRKKKLINKFGNLEDCERLPLKLFKPHYLCNKCHQKFHYFYDLKMISEMLESLKPQEESDKGLWNGPPEIEYVKI